DEDGELVRDWVGGLSVAGHPLVRGDATTPDQLCVRRQADEVAIGRGPDCETVVVIPPLEPGDAATTQLDRAVGAALAIGTEAQRQLIADAPDPEAVADPEARVEGQPPETPPESTESVAVLGVAEPRPVRPPPRDRSVRLHASIAVGASARVGGLDGAAIFTGGVWVRPGIVAAAEVTVIPANLDGVGVAVDTDVLGTLGYRLPIAPRSGLRFAGAGGARLHSYRIDGGRTQAGRATWAVGAELTGWWRVGRVLMVELGLRQRITGPGWRHEVGVNLVGERGRTTTMFVAGLGWWGRGG
ncbi:MAG: hypothetical protein AAF721_37525, partial [Myxococcota bacterium]